jgi:hypothetical protein
MNIFETKLFVALSIVFLLTGIVFCSEVIQTQESDSWEGIEVDLTSLKIRNSIVTLKFKFRNTSSDTQRGEFKFNACYIMDEVNQKKYYPLKDSDGNYIGGPMATYISGGIYKFDLQGGKTKSMWVKFPEPTDNPESITISIPGVFPFEEVVLTK